MAIFPWETEFTPQGISGASDPGLDPGEEAPRVGWGPNGLCPWGGAPEDNTTIRQAWPANRKAQIPRLDMGVAPKDRWRVVPVKDGLHPRRDLGGLRTRPRPGEEAPRVGRGPGGQHDDSAGLACESEEEAHGPPRPRDNAFPPCVRNLAEATRISIAEFGEREALGPPHPRDKALPRTPETRPKPPAVQSRNLGCRIPPFGRQRHTAYPRRRSVIMPLGGPLPCGIGSLPSSCWRSSSSCFPPADERGILAPGGTCTAR